MLEVWLVFLMGKGFFKGFVGIRCHHMKAQSMQFICALESMMAVVSMSFIVRGETMNFNLMYKEFFRFRVLFTVVGSSCIKEVLPLKNPG